MKPYRLLRNNKESGPYSAHELIQSGLKAYDLIWVEGKSASWRYPSEIEEFKPYAPPVEEQPFDRFYKKSSVTDTHNKAQGEIREGKIPDTEKNLDSAVAVKKEKPRIRIKADTKKIDIPVSQPMYPRLSPDSTTFKEPEEIAKIKEVPSPSGELLPHISADRGSVQGDTHGWKDMWLDWEEEKKAVAAARNANSLASSTYLSDEKSQSNSTQAKSNDNVLETKFSQSLDDIKERYIETVLNNSASKKAGTKKYASVLTIVILICAILGFGMWMGKQWSLKPAPAEQQIVSEPQSSGVKTTQKETETVPNEPEELLPVEQEPAPVLSTVIKDNKRADKSDEGVTHLPAAKKVATSKKMNNRTTTNEIQKLPAENKSFEKISPVQNNDIAKNKLESEPAAGNESPNQDQPAFSRSKKAEATITDYVNVEAYSPYPGSVVGVKLRVHNISEVPVDLVMLDLQYFDTNGRFQKGETVYLRNIASGQMVTVQAPDNSKSARVDYKISMVSSEENNLYLIAD